MTVAGVLLTKYNGRTTLSKDITSTTAEKVEQMGAKLLSTRIREGIAIKEAQTMQQSIFEYAPKSNPARDYSAFLDEISL